MENKCQNCEDYKDIIMELYVMGSFYTYDYPYDEDHKQKHKEYLKFVEKRMGYLTEEDEKKLREKYRNGKEV